MDLGEIEEVKIVLILMLQRLLVMVLLISPVQLISACHLDPSASIGGHMNKQRLILEIVSVWISVCDSARACLQSVRVKCLIVENFFRVLKLWLVFLQSKWYKGNTILKWILSNDRLILQTALHFKFCTRKFSSKYSTTYQILLMLFF